MMSVIGMRNFWSVWLEAVQEVLFRWSIRVVCQRLEKLLIQLIGLLKTKLAR